jgi:hypothetical protein
MAIYHVSVQVISRSEGRTATGAAAYRSGSIVVDCRTKIVYNYTQKTGVEHTEILTPIPAIDENAWMVDRAELWNQVEATEQRRDSQLCREINVAIPVELDRQQRIDLVREYVQTSYVDRGMVADICFHDFESNNPHAHIMLTMRELITDEDGIASFGKKERTWNDKQLLIDQRREWAEIANKYLAQADCEARIDHRSLAAQGITDRLPQIHLGANVAAMKERGIPTDRGDEYDRIATVNAEIADRLERIYQAEATLVDLGNDDTNIPSPARDDRPEQPRPEQPRPQRPRKQRPDFARTRRDAQQLHCQLEEFADDLQNPRPEIRPQFDPDRRDIEELAHSGEDSQPSKQRGRDRQTDRRDRETNRSSQPTPTTQPDPDRHQTQGSRKPDRHPTDRQSTQAEISDLSDQRENRGTEQLPSTQGLDRDGRIGRDGDDDVRHGLGDNRHQKQATATDRADTAIDPTPSDRTAGAGDDDPTGAAEPSQEEEEKVKKKLNSIPVIKEPEPKTKPRQSRGLSL